MKPQPMDYFVEMEEEGTSTVAMYMDDAEASEIFGEGLISIEHHRLADSDFFNSFQDDFDDSDIN